MINFINRSILINYFFDVVGGTMQTEEIVSRTQSTGIDGGPTDSASLQHHLHHTSHIKCPLPPLLHMAVKQEPQEEEERSRDTNALRWGYDYGNRHFPSPSILSLRFYS